MLSGWLEAEIERHPRGAVAREIRAFLDYKAEEIRKGDRHSLDCVTPAALERLQALQSTAAAFGSKAAAARMENPHAEA
jgi:hypothetical protein